MGLLITALMLFAAFHFLPAFNAEGERGWLIWPGIWNLFHNLPMLLRRSEHAVLISSFLTFSILVVASPFLTGLWLKSRLAWGLATLFSGIASAAFWFIVCYQERFIFGSVGQPCLAFALLGNFAGLLLAGPQRAKSGELTTAKENLDEPAED